ncbi:glycosyltransferase [Pedobacter mucosus]|uniref:glycosyltransferase n=1 Tax=Pedobacter mucosus TaxID=2895286 RepID=UPI001EE4E1FA|nr:glycosyltransferase [Pedobacter mucosus]UKT64387.1 glycosyltransferase [Pedobacter mucosus]
MKIVIIVNPVIPFPPQTVGGTERIAQYLIEELVKKGHEITLLGHDDSIVPTKVKFVGIGSYNDQKNTAKKVWFHLLSNKYDVIHNHGRLIYFLPRIWSSTRKVHTFHIAEILSNSFLNFFKLKPRKLILAPCARWIQIKHEGLPGDWQFVNNGIPKTKYYLGREVITEHSPLIIICRIGFGKGVLDAIEIAKRANKNLLIAGKGGDNPHEIEWFENVFLKQCDGKQIQYVGPINDMKKQELLTKSIGLLMLSIDLEAFNLTMLEANACGCPVISYNRYFPPDFIKPGVNGYIGNDREEIVEKVALLDKIDRKKCRLEFEANYTSAIMVNNYLKLYHQ